MNATYSIVQNYRTLGNIQIHKDKMADASAHDKQMENFMGPEEFVLSVKNGKL